MLISKALTNVNDNALTTRSLPLASEGITSICLSGHFLALESVVHTPYDRIVALTPAMVPCEICSHSLLAQLGSTARNMTRVDVEKNIRAEAEPYQFRQLAPLHT